MNGTVTAAMLKPILHESDPKTLAKEILQSLTYRLGKDASVATEHDWLTASIKVVRDRIIERWIASTKEAYDQQEKRVYYLSLEFLIGRLMRDAFSNLGLLDKMREALASLGVDLDVIARLEPDAALGNGGLGRLAACFMESMATVDVPAHGYGIRYVHGLFRQEFSDGFQVELPETWLDHGNPWEFERRERSFEVGFGGQVESITSKDGRLERHVWKPHDRVLAVAYDTPVVGWRGSRVNTLRLWSAMPVDPILLDAFNAGDHIGALRESNRAEVLTQVLYPADSAPGRPGTQAPPGVFLLRRLLAGHRAAAPQPVWRADVAARQGGHPSQRHPPGGGRGRADAAPDGRPRHRLRHRLGLDPAHLRLHQPHAVAGSAGELAGAAVRAAAAAPHADRLRHQRPAAARGAGLGPLRRRPDQQHLADPRGRRPPRPHGQSGLRRLAFHQRRLGTPHRADEADGVRRPAPALSGPHQQQDQRHHAAPLADPVQSAA